LYLPRNAVIRRTPFGSLPRPVAALAQSVEHIIRNDGVACSSHASGTKFFRKISGIYTAIAAVEMETSFSVKPLSPHCLQKKVDYRIRMEPCGGVLGLDAPRQSRFGASGARLEYGLVADDCGGWGAGRSRLPQRIKNPQFLRTCRLEPPISSAMRFALRTADCEASTAAKRLRWRLDSSADAPFSRGDPASVCGGSCRPPSRRSRFPASVSIRTWISDRFPVMPISKSPAPPITAMPKRSSSPARRQKPWMPLRISKPLQVFPALLQIKLLFGTE
jgi:hypothetical protein